MENHLIGIAFTEPYGHLHISEGSPDIIDHAIEQRVEIESGSNQIRRPLKLHEGLNEVAGRVDARGNRVAVLN